jgi:hypothetical protein
MQLICAMNGEYTLLQYQLIAVEPALICVYPAVQIISGNYSSKSHCVGFEVLTAVDMKTSIFWGLRPCIPLGANRIFAEGYRPHLQETITVLFVSLWFLACLILGP